MKRDLTSLTFQTSILCQRIGIAKDGFYSSMREAHKYDATDYDYIDKNFPLSQISLNPLLSTRRWTQTLTRLRLSA